MVVNRLSDSERQPLRGVPLTSAPGQELEPSLSPEGTHVAYSWNGEKQDNFDIYVKLIGPGPPLRLTTDPARDSSPAWSRDGRWIYFASRRTGTMQTWKMPAEGGNAIQLTKGGGGAGIESVDGKYFYYQKAQGLWKVPVEGGEETLVTREKRDFANYWALGDQGLYFFAPRGEEHKTILKLFRLETGQSSQIAVLDQPFPSHFMRLSLPADGRWLLYDQTDRNESDIMLIENFR